MAEYLYCRVSTDGQSTDAQTISLMKKYPKAVVVSETASGAKARPELKGLIERLALGDTLIVAAFDRLGRNVLDLLTMIQTLEANKVSMIFDREGFVMDANEDEKGFNKILKRMMMQMLASLAEMERAIISERTKAGIEAARAKGKRIGRPREIDDGTILRGVELVIQHGFTIRKAADTVRISVPYLSMALRSHRRNESQ